MSSQYPADADAIDEEGESPKDHRVGFNRRILPTMLRYREPESSKSNTGCCSEQTGKALGCMISPMIANRLTTTPPIRNLIRRSLIDRPVSPLCALS
jgi:hypothetical protein